MSDPPTTRPSLLVRLRDARDEQAWSHFVDIYAPLVYGYARKHGLQDADAADVTQEVLRSVARSMEGLEYDPRRGTFHGWLLTVTRNALRKFWRRRQRQPQGSGNTAVQRLVEERTGDRDPDADAWDQEHERRLFQWAAERIRGSFQESTWQAFWETAVEGNSPRQIADSLGMSLGAVYIAKSRVLARLKEQIDQVRGEIP